MSMFDVNREYVAPAETWAAKGKKIFLAGTIEMGKGEDWQKYATDKIRSANASIFNPRRKKWNANLEQSRRNEEFVEQVMWEQSNLEKADIVLFNFLPDTYSMITLLEFGQFCIRGNRDKHVVVACPNEYMRSGNIQVMCALYGIPIFETLDDAIAHINIII